MSNSNVDLLSPVKDTVIYLWVVLPVVPINIIYNLFGIFKTVQTPSINSVYNQSVF